MFAGFSRRFIGTSRSAPFAPSSSARAQSSLCTYVRHFRNFAGNRSSRATLPVHHRRHSPKVRTLEASSWTALLSVGAIGGTCAIIAYLYQYSSSLSTSEIGTGPREADSDTFDIEMLAEHNPGHAGNLTEEQENKLREFWAVTLKTFGVELPAEIENSTTAVADEAASIDTPDDTASSATDKDKKKSKKKLGIFRSKKGDKEEKDSSSTNQTDGKPSSEDDKYGQTKEFQHTMETHSPEELRAAFWSMVKCDHPDSLLLRFLRARKWDIEKALIMLVATMNWRMKDVHVDDDIMPVGEPGALEHAKSSDKSIAKEGDDFLDQLRLGKSFLHGTDKDGRPLCHVRVRLHRQGEQSQTSLERYTVYMIETARLLLVPPVETACIIFDMSNFTLANMDYAPVKFMIKCFEANYPESLGAVLVHKAPWVFQGIWKIIKGWLDPVVASKVHFTNSVEDLEGFIAKSHIIKELGGDDSFEYEYIEPLPEETPVVQISGDARSKRDRLLQQRAETVLDFQKKTYQWITSPSDEVSKTLMQDRDTLARRLKDGYWELDPMLRARSWYDRTGVINPGGKIDFYPERTKAVDEKSEAIAEAPVETLADDVD